MHKTFLIEIGTEELPPKQLKKLAESFHNTLITQFKEIGLSHGESAVYATPRRLAVQVHDMQYKQDDLVEEALGPMADKAFDGNGAPLPAATGFAKKLGIPVEALATVSTPKGDRLAGKLEKPGKELPELLEPILQTAVKSLPQQRWMRWSDKAWLFVRPVQWFIAMYADRVLNNSFYGKSSSNISRGHRFLSNGEVTIKNASSYESDLKAANVIVDFDARKNTILSQTREIEEKIGQKALFDERLLNEVTSLVENPCVLMGAFNESFLDVPQEALVSSMQEHQKYFPMQDQNQNLTNKFLIISNMTITNPSKIISGNEKVINARLNDALFFFNQDRKHKLADNNTRLKDVLFFEGLGSIYDKTTRISSLSAKIAGKNGADIDSVKSAASICKADLVSEMVGEFPELQGIMGGYYASFDGYDDKVSKAISEHYLPKSANDKLPSTKEATCLALADRLDSLAGLFLLGKQPLKDKDPYGLRRQSLAVAKILIESEMDLSMHNLFSMAVSEHKPGSNDAVVEALCDFTIDRIKSWQQTSINPKFIDAALSVQNDNPYDFYRRLNAIVEFAKTDAASSLAEANKRVKNILVKNEISSKIKPNVNVSLFEEAEEHNLWNKLISIQKEIEPLAQTKNYQQVMENLSSMKDPVDAFFQNVMVMSDKVEVKNNRINMLISMRQLFTTVGDISLL